MMITKDTKLADLLQEYPLLKSEVMQISDKLKNAEYAGRQDHAEKGHGR